MLDFAIKVRFFKLCMVAGSFGCYLMSMSSKWKLDYFMYMWVLVSSLHVEPFISFASCVTVWTLGFSWTLRFVAGAGADWALHAHTTFSDLGLSKVSKESNYWKIYLFLGLVLFFSKSNFIWLLKTWRLLKTWTTSGICCTIFDIGLPSKEIVDAFRDSTKTLT